MSQHTIKKRSAEKTPKDTKQNRLFMVCSAIAVLLFTISIILAQFISATRPYYKPEPITPHIKDKVSQISKQENATQQTPKRFKEITQEQRSIRIPVLMYHDIQDIPQSNDPNIMPKSQFEAQLKYLKDNGFTTITAQEFMDAYSGKINLPKNTLMLTFDDGFKSMKTIVHPLLKQYDMHAVSFIIGDYTNRPDFHLTVDEIKSLQAEHTIDFESHTFNFHRDGTVKGIINEMPVNEIVADNQKMESIINHKTNFLAYPSGAFSNGAIEGLKASNIPFGFAITSGFSTWVYLNETHTTTKGEVQNPQTLPRVRINANTPIAEYANLITDN